MWDLFCCGAGSSLWCVGFSLVVARGISLSSCGTWAPGNVGSVVVVHGVPGTWVLLFVARGLSH